MAVQVTHLHIPTYTHRSHNTCMSTHKPAKAQVRIHSFRYVCRSTHALPSSQHPDIYKLKNEEKSHLLVKPTNSTTPVGEREALKIEAKEKPG